MSEKQKTQYDFRGEIFEKRKCKGDKEYFIIDFACKQKALAGKGKSKFNDGPVVSIDEKSLPFLIYYLSLTISNQHGMLLRNGFWKTLHTRTFRVSTMLTLELDVR